MRQLLDHWIIGLLDYWMEISEESVFIFVSLESPQSLDYQREERTTCILERKTATMHLVLFHHSPLQVVHRPSGVDLDHSIIDHRP
jgi:hypothetical protein